jgi:hypothetical protein
LPNEIIIQSSQSHGSVAQTTRTRQDREVHAENKLHAVVRCINCNSITLIGTKIVVSLCFVATTQLAHLVMAFRNENKQGGSAALTIIGDIRRVVVFSSGSAINLFPPARTTAIFQPQSLSKKQTNK